VMMCTSYDYHNDINSLNFMNYVTQQLITNMCDYGNVL
jgi:hypothetical protein